MRIMQEAGTLSPTFLIGGTGTLNARAGEIELRIHTH